MELSTGWTITADLRQIIVVINESLEDHQGMDLNDTIQLLPFPSLCHYPIHSSNAACLI